MSIRPSLGWRIVAAGGAVVVLLVSVGAWLVAAPSGALVVALPLLALAPVSMWILVRVWIVSVSYDMNSLKVVGAVWSRTIPRHSIIAVDKEPDNAWVTWRGRTGRRRMTPLTPLWGNRFGWMPVAQLKQARDFLRRVARWAGN